MHSLLLSVKNDDSISLASKIETDQAADESSLMNYLNSSRFSAVGHERDIYAEDIVI